MFELSSHQKKGGQLFHACAAFRLVFVAMRWKRTGAAPRFADRRWMLFVYENNAIDSKFIDLMFGPAISAKLADKTRRKRMALYHFEASLSQGEKIARALSKLFNAMAGDSK